MQPREEKLSEDSTPRFLHPPRWKKRVKRKRQRKMRLTTKGASSMIITTWWVYVGGSDDGIRNDADHKPMMMMSAMIMSRSMQIIIARFAVLRIHRFIAIRAAVVTVTVTVTTIDVEETIRITILLLLLLRVPHPSSL